MWGTVEIIPWGSNHRNWEWSFLEPKHLDFSDWTSLTHHPLRIWRLIPIGITVIPTTWSTAFPTATNPHPIQPFFPWNKVIQYQWLFRLVPIKGISGKKMPIGWLYPTGSRGLLYFLPTFMIDSPLKTSIHVAKYTVRFMDPMGMLPTDPTLQKGIQVSLHWSIYPTHRATDRGPVRTPQPPRCDTKFHTAGKRGNPRICLCRWRFKTGCLGESPFLFGREIYISKKNKKTNSQFDSQKDEKVWSCELLNL